MRLVILIPAFNEEDVLGRTIRALPRRVQGFEKVEILVVDDGSEDGTSRIAKESGCDRLFRFGRHLGLAAAFSEGVSQALEMGADVLVNFDADGQYRVEDLEAILSPILNGEADLVVGERPLSAIKSFSLSKKLLHRFGNAVIRRISGIHLSDVTSGFRAMNRRAMSRTVVFDPFTYTLETIVQAGRTGLRVAGVSVKVNEPTRPSRLMRNTSEYVFRSVLTILRVLLTNKPLAFFLGLAALCGGGGASIASLALLDGNPINSLPVVFILTVSMSLCVFFGTAGILANLVSLNRRLLEHFHFLANLRRTPIEDLNPDKEILS